MMDETYKHLRDCLGGIASFEMNVRSTIKSDESFRKAYDSFLRDWKISNIIGEK